jgi:hypothetical protein
MELAREADRTGIIRHFVATKDVFRGVDGVVTGGSKTTYITDWGASPLMERLVDQGFIPVPCGMTAGAHGGSGLYNGHGEVGNSARPRARLGRVLVGARLYPGPGRHAHPLAIATDTGGSISAPCGAGKFYGWVPEKGLLSRINMIPSATHLDTPGVMGVDRDEVLRLAKLLTIPAYQSRYQASKQAPEVFYIEEDKSLVSADSGANFGRRIEECRARGFSVTALDPKFKISAGIPSRCMSNPS